MRANDIVRRRRARARPANILTQRSLRGAAAVALLVALLAVFVPAAALAGGAAALLAFLGDLPAVDTLRALPGLYEANPATTLLYAYGPPDADGLRGPIRIDEIVDPRRGARWLRYDDLPPAVVEATLAAADPAYFSAPPADLARAIDEWRRTGVITQAHSPILRALIDIHLRDEPAAGDTRRALQDWLLGWQIERRFGREQVLEWTLNTAYYGHLAYGIDAAARLYFGVPATELTAGQAAQLVAVARDPAANPFDAPEAAQAGQEVVLAAMTRHGFATDGAATPLDLAPPPGSDSAVPAFARLARAELERLLGPEALVRGGYRVETTLDPALQAQAACVVAAAGGGPSLGGSVPCPSAALLDEPVAAPSAAVVALNPAEGTVSALVADAAGPPARPIGPLVHPLIALTALSQGYTAASLSHDVERIYLHDGRPYVPLSDGAYRGPLRLREALAGNRPAAMAQVLGWVGATRVLAGARALGLTPLAGALDDAPVLALAERGFPADLLSVSHAFATIGNGGTMAGHPARPATIRRVTDNAGAEVYALAGGGQETLSPELAWLLTDMLAGDNTLPDGRRVALARAAAPDTGDGWAVGFTPQRLIGVWAAGDAANGDAAGAAEAIWRALMTQAHAGDAPADWPRPGTLRAVEVCALSGQLPQRGAAACRTVREWFVPGTEPTAVDTMTREVAINRETGRLATLFTPLRLIERRIYTVYPPEAAAWAADQGIAAPPTEYDTIRRLPLVAGGAAITSPEPWTAVGGQASAGQLPVVGSASGPNFAYYRLAYFPGLLPEAMQVIVARAEQPVENGELGLWDTTLLEDGLYTLLLTVARTDGTYDEVAIPVVSGSVEQ